MKYTKAKKIVGVLIVISAMATGWFYARSTSPTSQSAQTGEAQVATGVGHSNSDTPAVLEKRPNDGNSAIASENAQTVSNPSGESEDQEITPESNMAFRQTGDHFAQSEEEHLEENLQASAALMSAEE